MSPWKGLIIILLSEGIVLTTSGIVRARYGMVPGGATTILAGDGMVPEGCDYDSCG